MASRLSACCSRLPTKPGMSFLHMHRLSAGVAQELDGLSHGLVAGHFVLDHLDQRHEMRRIPEMRADHALAMLELCADLGRGDCRAVAGEDRCRARSALSSSAKICCLSGSFSGAASNTKVASCIAGAIWSWAEMRPSSAGSPSSSARALSSRCGSVCPPFRRRIVDADRVSGRRQQIGDAVAHQARADHADVQTAHVIPLASPWQ